MVSRETCLPIRTGRPSDASAPTTDLCFTITQGMFHVKPSPAPRICDYEGSDYRERFWEQADRGYEDAAERLAIRRLLPANGRRLAEIGAGFGRLVDEYRLFLTTSVVGGGTRFFPDGVRLDLDLIEHRSFDNGLIYARYQTP